MLGGSWEELDVLGGALGAEPDLNCHLEGPGWAELRIIDVLGGAVLHRFPLSLGSGPQAAPRVMEPKWTSLSSLGGAGGSSGAAPGCGADAGPTSQGVVGAVAAQHGGGGTPCGSLLRHLLGHRGHCGAAGVEGPGGGKGLEPTFPGVEEIEAYDSWNLREEGLVCVWGLCLDFRVMKEEEAGGGR